MQSWSWQACSRARAGPGFLARSLTLLLHRLDGKRGHYVMAKVTVAGDTLSIEIQGLDKL